ncbi:unnamed protein product [Larinioides sclopetarius]|uniref:Knr4/Smi1-like domain-containing protein n=1 Tax=Larinioides sclopetarius TaxID=280406 RepID=A0AAV2AQL5_9ARAC
MIQAEFSLWRLLVKWSANNQLTLDALIFYSTIKIRTKIRNNIKLSMDRSPFIENLTLGIAKYIEKLPCVKSTVISEKTHVQEAALTAWEQKNSCILPQDLKNFYLATDGLQIKWYWKQRGETVPCGVIEIARLSHLKSIGPKRQSINSELPSLLDIESDSEDSSSDGSSQQPSIWFLDRALDFHYLTSDFASYYRLALAHLGIPQWQWLFTPYGPPTRTRNVWQLIIAFG